MLPGQLQSLLNDARLVLDYAVRAGKLPDNSLSVAIHRTERLGPDDEPDIAELQRALNAVLVAIAPMTLVDLRAGRSPFDERNIRGRKRWQVGLSGATLALIASIAYYQYVVQQQDTALHAFQEVQDARGSEKITAARKYAQYGKALEQNSCRFDDYQKARHELRLLADRTLVVTGTMHTLAQTSAWPFGSQFERVADWVDRLVTRGGSAHAAESSAVTADAAGATSAAGAAGAAPSAAEAQPAQPPLPAAGEINDLCNQHAGSSIVTAYPAWLQQVVADSVDEFCFANKLSVDYLVGSDYFRGEVDPVPVLQQRIRVQTGWLLPFLYGLLGACVFVMRRLLFDTQTAAVEHIVILLRLALGALAGVVIGWFAAPTLGSGVTVSQVSSLPYVLAFLAGFSIDNLFTVLDRINSTLTGKAKADAATPAA